MNNSQIIFEKFIQTLMQALAKKKFDNLLFFGRLEGIS